MNRRVSRLMLGLVITAIPLFTIGCGSTNNNPGHNNHTGSVNTMMSDASTEDWATIGVKVLSISLTPAAAGAPVAVYTAPTPAPIVNLVQLDQLSELLANATVATGTYTGATLTISANPGDILLTAAADPATGFAGTAGATVPAGQIQIMGATGAVGSLTVPVSVTFAAPLVVSANLASSFDLEFQLSHPAFLVPHVPAVGLTEWAVDFNGTVLPHPIADIAHLVLRHIYGTATAVSVDNTSITITKDFPLEPPITVETPVATTEPLTILADATNGTIFYDIDAATATTIMNFSSVSATLDGKFVRVAARYQANGTLVAVRVWASTSFNKVFQSPEGHVLHVDNVGHILTVENELGVGVPVTISATTQFFFRTPGVALSDFTPIGTGTAFLTNVVRGFKVHASAVDPLASPLVAQTIDIEIAKYDGTISAATLANFLDTRTFTTVADNYALTLPFISASSSNGADPVTGTAIAGFKWWNFTLPTIVTSGATAISTFDTATSGSATFAGTTTAFKPAGEGFAIWNDPAAVNAWAMPWEVLLPSNVPLGTVAAGYSAGAFTMSIPNGAVAVTINLSTTAGSGTLVYQVDRTGTVVTITPIDITTTAGQTTLTTDLVTTTPVKVFGVPQVAGTIKAYVVLFFTGTAPTS